MYRKIVVGYDSSERSRDALALAALIARQSVAQLVVAGVFQFDPISGVRDPASHEAAVDYSREIEQAAASVGAEAEALLASSAGRGLHELAEELDADLIVIGSAHNEPPSVSYGRSGSAGTRALEEVIEEAMRKELAGATESVPQDVRVEPVLASGEPAATLAELANVDGAVLMLGSRAYGPLRRVLLGSVSAALARSAPCPLIVHPRPAKPPVHAGPHLAAAGAL